MIKSYEQFKSFTSDVFNSKAKTLNELRSVCAKSLGFSSTEALIESISSEKSTEAVSNVGKLVVIQIFEGFVGKVQVFENSVEGREQSEAAFMKIIEDYEDLEGNKIDGDGLKALAKKGYARFEDNDYFIKVSI